MLSRAVLALVALSLATCESRDASSERQSLPVAQEATGEELSGFFTWCRPLGLLMDVSVPEDTGFGITEE